MEKINKVALALSKISEVFHWGLAIVMLATLICSITAADWLKDFLERYSPQHGINLSNYGFEVMVTDSAGNANITTVFLFSIGATIIAVLMAMIFHNVYLIIKKAQKTTPFNEDNVRMLKRISLFAIAIPIVGFIMTSIIPVVVGINVTEIAVNLDGLTISILVYCLTRFFEHGVEIETDVDGLL